MPNKMRTVLGAALTPTARAWIRYAPVSIGKSWLWQNFHWRPRAFSCRTRSGAIVTGNTQDLIQRHLYYFGTWEPNISSWISSTLKPGDAFIDIGANIGHYSLLASSIVGADGSVVAIEAARWIHCILDKHVAMNGRRNVRTVQVAAAAVPGVLNLFPGAPDNIGKTTTVSHDANSVKGDTIQVKALPLSDILREDEIKRARIIKIDVEGGELEVLRGMAPLLGRMRSDLQIIMEVSPSLMPDAQRSREEIFATMRDNGFAAYVLDNDYGVETYFRRGQETKPQLLTDERIQSQADILFSRTRY